MNKNYRLQNISKYFMLKFWHGNKYFRTKMKESVILLVLLVVVVIDARKISQIWKKKNESLADPIFQTTTEQVPRIVGYGLRLLKFSFKQRWKFYFSGEPTDIKFFPHQVSVRHFDYHICGGSVSERMWQLQ